MNEQEKKMKQLIDKICETKITKTMSDTNPDIDMNLLKELNINFNEKPKNKVIKEKNIKDATLVELTEKIITTSRPTNMTDLNSNIELSVLDKMGINYNSDDTKNYFVNEAEDKTEIEQKSADEYISSNSDLVNTLIRAKKKLNFVVTMWEDNENINLDGLIYTDDSLNAINIAKYHLSKNYKQSIYIIRVYDIIKNKIIWSSK